MAGQPADNVFANETPKEFATERIGLSRLAGEVVLPGMERKVPVEASRYPAGFGRLATDFFRAAAFRAGEGAAGSGWAIPVFTAKVPRADPIAVAARWRRSGWLTTAGVLVVFFRGGIAAIGGDRVRNCYSA
jgi:hypothetical protein